MRRPGQRHIVQQALCLGVLLGLSAHPLLPGTRTKCVVLVTGDGIRWQEVFRGADPSLLHSDDHGMKEAAEVRQKFGGSSREERRERLMPFLWTVVARQGVIVGDRDRNQIVRLQNRYRFSYPGYSELLTGRPQDDVVNSNANRPNPSETVLEIVRRELRLPRDKVAVFASWEVFHGIAAHSPGSIFVNAGYDALDSPPTPRSRELSQAQFQLLTPWRSVRHDYITFELAMEHLRSKLPRLLYVALGETDDWAHQDRYDRYLEALHYFDHCLERLWKTLQSLPAYRGQTTLLIATDHGRGDNPSTWPRHGEKVPEAAFVWLAALGPDTPPGEPITTPIELTASDLAPTLLELLGMDSRRLLPQATGRPVELILRKGKTHSQDAR